MSVHVTIYGKAGWPYTQRARQAYPEHEYIDVKAFPERLEEMLKLSKGERKVPVISDQGRVTIGYGGSWGIWKAGREPAH